MDKGDIVFHKPSGSFGQIKSWAYEVPDAVIVSITKPATASHHHVGDSHIWLVSELKE